MVQIIPAAKRRPSFGERLSQGIGSALETGARLYEQHQRQKNFQQSMQNLEGIYANPDLSEQQKLLETYRQLGQFPEQAQQLAGGLSRLGVQNQRNLADQLKGKQTTQALQNIKNTFSNPDLSFEDKIMGVYEELSDNPALAHHIVGSLQQHQKAQGEDIAGRQFATGYNAILEGDKEALKDDTKMTVKKKASKVQHVQYDIDDIINRGGKTTVDSKQQPNPDAEIRFTLRISEKMIKKLDADRESRVGNVSRNQWILEAIAERLN